MKIINFNDIVNMDIPAMKCYEWVSEVIHNKNDFLLPKKISLKPEMQGVFYNTMPAILPNIQLAGVKVVTRYPERVPSLDSQILLYDLQSGKNIALVDGNWITAMRTGAVAAHSIRLFAKSGFSVLGFIGLGNTARATLNVLLSLYPEKKFTMKLKKYKDQHKLFHDRFRRYRNLNFIYCDTFEEVVSDSDVLVSAATVFEEDICPDHYFKEGILVIPIHTRGFTNCDLFFDKVYADDFAHVKQFKHFNEFRYFAETTDVVNSRKPGRTSDKERILAYNIGIALHDIYFAGKIYKLAEKNCMEISLNAPTDKFWV